MKNKMMMIGSLCLVLALGLVFAGCDEFTKAELGSSAKPSIAVAAGTGAGNEKYFLVTWDAVSNATGYTVVFQPTGKKTIDELGDDADNSVTYTTGGTPTTNKNIDKWSAWVKIDKDDYDVGTGKIGVYANFVRRDKNPAIAWSDTVTLK